MADERTHSGRRPLRVVLAAASVGCGHKRAALAVSETLASRGRPVESTLLEVLDEAPAWFRMLYHDGYLRAVRHAPWLVGAMYDAADVPARDRRMLAGVLDRVEDAVTRRFRARAELHAADVVVSTHFLTTAVLGRMRLRGQLHAPLVTVVTDEHPHSAWIHPGSDATCVASHGARETAIAAGLRPERVHATGIPIDPRFCLAQPACAPDGRPKVLACGGGYGLGGIDRAVASLLAMPLDAEVTVVCGKNAALERTLRSLATAHGNRPGRPSLRVIGLTGRMHELMAESDLMVGKPGGLTTSEARAMALPMVLLRPIPGQEERNARALVAAGAAVRAPRPQDVGATVAAILSDRCRLVAMRTAAAALGRPRAAFDVATRVEAIVRARSRPPTAPARPAAAGGPSAWPAAPATT